MALIKSFPLRGGYTAQYIKLSEYFHQKDVKRSESILTVWKDAATRAAFLAGDQDAKPTDARIRVLIESPTEFDAVFPDGEFSEGAIYDALKAGTVLCHSWHKSDLTSTPAAQRMLYGAADA